MRCAASAAVTVGTASGLRAWLRARRGAWLTPRRMRFATVALVLGSGVALQWQRLSGPDADPR